MCDVDPVAAPRVAFYVQHLLGIGHLARACRIAAALAADGWDVDLLVGGEMPPGLSAGGASIVALPPVRAGAGALSALQRPDGTPFDAAAQAHRRDLLLAHVDVRPPDVLIVEAFPFGRRQMRFELLPLLRHVAARNRPPLVASSVRDILQENRRPERVAEALDLLDRHFDLVLVHGDPTLAGLDLSFPSARSFAGKIRYTGLVAPDPAPVPSDPGAAATRSDVVVSVGGGAVGEALLRTALAARPLSRLRDSRWLLLHGPNLDAAARDALQASVQDGVTLTPFVPDLAAVLGGCTVSVSQAGYNTVADILVAGCRAVLIPYAQDGETEQRLRADLLARRGRAVALAEDGLTPAGLAAAIDLALDLPVAPAGLDTDGARKTSALLRTALAERRSRQAPSETASTRSLSALSRDKTA